MSPICIPLRIKEAQNHLICQEAEEALEEQAWQDVKGPRGESRRPQLAQKDAQIQHFLKR